MKSVYTESFRMIERLAKSVDVCAVAFSGGNDSLVVLDMVWRVFGRDRTKAFFMYTVPDLSVCEGPILASEQRYGIQVVRYPHWDILNSITFGVWCDDTKKLRQSERLTLKDGYARGLELAGGQIILTGMKDADGLKRRQFFANLRDNADDPVWSKTHHPIRSWKKKDVMQYLSSHKIPVPPTIEGKVTTGVGLTHDQICWLHDNYPDDYKKFLKYFPYAEACIRRRDWFGVR